VLEGSEGAKRAGNPDELIKGPLRRGQHDDLEQLRGQRKYAVIEFEDGTIYREKSAAMGARLKDGLLFKDRETAA
jgi:hypothetical protein